MSGFQPDWLALREPADLRARNPEVLAAVRERFQQRDFCRVVDLGAGTGASLRALAPMLPRRQSWILFDNDAGNLRHACEACMLWADRSEARGDRLLLQAGGSEIEMRTLTADLSTEPLPLPDTATPDLVTASALLDLTSVVWLENLARRLAVRRLPFLAMLTFNGTLSADPPHESDAEMRAAFNRHQRQDKGFGPAAGGDAAPVLARLLHAEGFEVTLRDSAWRLDGSQAALLQATLQGWISAVSEMPDTDDRRRSQWARARRSDTAALLVGHLDLWALPRR